MDTTPTTPEAFLCRLCRGLMEDPVVLPSGDSFDRHCVKSCIDLGFLPPTTTFTTNANLRSAILHHNRSFLDRSDSFSSFPSSPSSSASSSSFSYHDHLSPFSAQPQDPYGKFPVGNPPDAPNPSLTSEGDLVEKLKSDDASELEEGLRHLRKETRDSRAQRLDLYTKALLSALLPHLDSRDAGMQSDATASLFNLSLEKPNKTTVLQSGAVPVLVSALGSPIDDVRSNVAAALFSLSMESSNTATIGYHGAVPALLRVVVNPDETHMTRADAAKALHHLSSTCERNAVNLARTEGVVPTLLAVAAENEMGELGKAVLFVVLSLGGWPEGRAVLTDEGAVEVVVGILRRAEGAMLELCVRVLYALRKMGWRFWVEAKRLGVDNLLEGVWAREAESGMKKAAEVARRFLVDMEAAADGGRGTSGEWTSAGLRRSVRR